MNQSEYNTAPRAILVHHPKVSNAFQDISENDKETHNLLDIPEVDKLYVQYDHLMSVIRDAGIDTIELDHLVDEDLTQSTNPNLIFMRDSSITLPWDPDVFIPARLRLPAREHETKLAQEALVRLGKQPIIEFEQDEYLEGGDVLPVTFQGLRTIIVGFGARTTQAAALKLARTIVPKHADMILGLRHDPEILHLDTGFTILPQQNILAIKGMFNDGFLITKDQKIQSIDPIEYAERLGFSIFRVDMYSAITQELCNMLPLGENRYVSFGISDELKEKLEVSAGIKITRIDGSEISKATGGVHCLTRPIY